MKGRVMMLIHYLQKQPKRLFLIDSIGAIVTAFSLLFWGRVNDFIGLPQTTLTYLAVIAFCFCIYSAVCYFILQKNWTPFIRLIGIANLLYCILTMRVIIVDYSSLTLFGLFYLIGEIFIVCGLVYIEFKVANALKN